METRVGIGFDIHPLAEGRPLMIGGIEIPYVKGLRGHSDGDVLIHAVCDALLGAAGKGDIGEYFPDSDPALEGVCSVRLLEKAVEAVGKGRYVVTNLDIVLIAAEPDFSPFKRSIRQKLSAVLGIAEDRVTVKAKTNNGLGETGAGAAIACHAAVALTKE